MLSSCCSFPSLASLGPAASISLISASDRLCFGCCGWPNDTLFDAPKAGIPVPPVLPPNVKAPFPMLLLGSAGLAGGAPKANAPLVVMGLLLALLLPLFAPKLNSGFLAGEKRDAVEFCWAPNVGAGKLADCDSELKGFEGCCDCCEAPNVKDCAVGGAKADCCGGCWGGAAGDMPPNGLLLLLLSTGLGCCANGFGMGDPKDLDGETEREPGRPLSGAILVMGKTGQHGDRCRCRWCCCCCCCHCSCCGR